MRRRQQVNEDHERRRLARLRLSGAGPRWSASAPPPLLSSAFSLRWPSISPSFLRCRGSPCDGLRYSHLRAVPAIDQSPLPPLPRISLRWASTAPIPVGHRSPLPLPRISLRWASIVIFTSQPSSHMHAALMLQPSSQARAVLFVWFGGCCIVETPREVVVVVVVLKQTNSTCSQPRRTPRPCP